MILCYIFYLIIKAEGQVLSCALRNIHSDFSIKFITACQSMILDVAGFVCSLTRVQFQTEEPQPSLLLNSWKLSRLQWVCMGLVQILLDPCLRAALSALGVEEEAKTQPANSMQLCRVGVLICLCADELHSQGVSSSWHRLLKHG